MNAFDRGGGGGSAGRGAGLAEGGRGPADPASISGGGQERRANLILRALIDEMLERVRELNRNSQRWTEEEMARAQAELEALMARVRKAAVRSDST